MKIGFIGAGNMGGAIARGIIRSGVVQAEDVFLYDVNPETSGALARDTGATAVRTAEDLTAAADLFVLAVKPVYVKDALRACYSGLAGKAVVSIVAGLTGDALSRQLPEGTRCLQTMPNTPAMVNEGVTALCEENTLTAGELAFVRRMFEAIGRVYTLPARLIEAESAVAGSGPRLCRHVYRSHGRRRRAPGVAPRAGDGNGGADAYWHGEDDACKRQASGGRQGYGLLARRHDHRGCARPGKGLLPL